MKLLRRTFLLQLQCCLWTVLTVFASIGCSAKQNLFDAFDFAIEKPLSGSKALSSAAGLNCSMITSSRKSGESISAKQVYLKNRILFATSLGTNAFLNKKENISEDYILELAGTDPPLYLMFQQIKLALL